MPSHQFGGSIFARGGDASGDGGFIEVSGKQGLAFVGHADTTAANGATGTVLIDPTDIDVLANDSDQDGEALTIVPASITNDCDSSTIRSEMTK